MFSQNNGWQRPEFWDAISYLLSQSDERADVKSPALWFIKDVKTIRFYSFDEPVLVKFLSDLNVQYTIQLSEKDEEKYYKYFIFASDEDFNTASISLKMHFNQFK